MKIKRLAAKNLKGLSFAHDLGEATVFIGKNGSGKSARLEAAMIGLLGYLPSLGKRNADTMELSSSVGMSVELEFGEENLSGKNTLVLQRNAKGVKAKKDFAVESVSVDMVNLDEFMALSFAKKVDHLFQRSGVEVTQKQAMAATSISANDDTERAFVEEIGDIIHACFEQNDTPFEALTAVNDAIVGELKETRAEAKTTRKTVEGLATLATDAPINPQPAIDKLEAEMKDVGQARAQTQASIQDRHAKLEQLNQLRDQEQAPDESERVTELEEHQRKLERLFEEDHSLELNELRDKLADFTKSGEALKKLRESLIGGQMELEKELEELLDDSVKRACPTCGHAVDAEVLHAEASERLQKHQAQLDQVTGELASIAAHWKTTNRQVKEVALVVQAEQDAKEQHKLAGEELMKLRATANAADGQLEAQIKRLEADVADVQELMSLLATHDARLSQITQSIATLRADQQKFLQWETEHSTGKRAEEQASLFERRVELWKAAQDQFAKFKTDVAVNSVDKIVSTANKLIGVVIPGARVALEDAFGIRTADGAFIPFDALSGSQRACMAAGLSMGLSKDKVLIVDELSRFDKTHKVRFINTVKKLIQAGELEQFIGADCRPLDKSLTGIDSVRV
jgi:energy-coupling factor transporter ATP-binding protein EcfA2